MAASNITMNDGAAVSRTFNPVNYGNGVTAWENRASGNLATYDVLSASVRRPRAGARTPVYRGMVKLRVVQPQVVGVADSGITPPVRAESVAWVNVEVIIPEQFAAEKRADLLAFIKGGLANSQIGAVFTDLAVSGA